MEQVFNIELVDFDEGKVLKKVAGVKDYGLAEVEDLREALIRDCVCANGEYYFFPSLGKGIFKLSLEQEKVSLVDDCWLNGYKDFINFWRTEGYSNIVKINNGYAIFNCRKGLLCVADYSLNHWTTHKVTMILDDTSRKKFLKNSFLDVGSEQDNEYFSLKSFIDYVADER